MSLQPSFNFGSSGLGYNQPQNYGPPAPSWLLPTLSSIQNSPWANPQGSILGASSQQSAPQSTWQSTQNRANPPSSGGGGGGNGGGQPTPRPNPIDTGPQSAPDPNNPNDWQNILKQQQLGKEVDSAYGEANNYYDQLYNDTAAGKQNYLDQYSSLFDAQRPGLDTAYQQGKALNENQTQQTYQGENNAIDSARRLFSELSQGVQQRYGGSNSAGDFANAFYNRQLQQNLGNIQNTTGQNVNNLQLQGANILNQYQANLKELESKKASALSAAQDSFQQRLNAITDAKGQLAQNKAAMKLQALQDYRNTINAVQMQAQQFAQNLYAQHSAAADQLKTQVAGYSAYSGKPIDLQGIQALEATPLGSSRSFQSAIPTGYVNYLNPDYTRRMIQGNYQ